MKHEPINPESLGATRGYSNGMLAKPGRLLFVAGQIGWGPGQKLVGPGMIEQFGAALANVVTVVRQAGGQPDDIVRLTIFCVDKVEYIAGAKAIGVAYRNLMGKHFPAMSLIVVKDLLEEGAKVEIEATAVIT